MVTPSMVAPVATEVTEPLRVRSPEVVTVPERLRPLADPVPLTEVTVPVLVVYPAGLLELYGVYPSAVVTCPLVSVRVPPRVSDPLVVTVPVRVRPETVPVPLTEVTVPVPGLIVVQIGAEPEPCEISTCPLVP